jgi:hypothetical protein
LLVDWLIALRLKDHLCFPVAVAQVDEDNAAKVTASIDPAAEGGLLSNISITKLAAGVCSLFERGQVMAMRVWK